VERQTGRLVPGGRPVDQNSPRSLHRGLSFASETAIVPVQESRRAQTPIVPPEVVTTDWRRALPVIEAKKVTLRDLRLSDAESLLAYLNTEEVSRFISPPPTTHAGFERFIEWTHRERVAGHYVCFAVVPEGLHQAIGIIQVRQLNGSFEVAEWGFAIGSEFWGSGVFIEAARHVVAFTFASLATTRLEARASVQNGRGNGALQKLGATREGILRKSFLRDGEYHDQTLWSLVRSDWSHTES
jgi:ribosomal-protein-alanine N-acetyltransferase